MGHFTKIRLERFLETSNPLELVASMPAMLLDTMHLVVKDFIKTYGDKEQAPPPSHPIDIAIQALELYRSGQWTREKAMSVIKDALAEFRQPECGKEWVSKPISLPALPGAKVHVRLEDVDLLNQLFN